MPDHAHDADLRLATYGSLSPGQVNHHELAPLRGRWLKGTVKGKLADEGWGATLGFPALILDPLGASVDVYLFQSQDLPDHWPRLDEFEGPGYQRVVVQVDTAEGSLPAHIYVLAASDSWP